DRVHAYARRILELNDEAVHAVRGAAIDGTVCFGLPGDFAESWLPAALGKFRKAYPAVRVDVLVERNALLLERLDRGELDLVLAMNQSKRADAERLATGLGITVRIGADLPSSLMRLDQRHGLPPLPSVDLCLHTAPGPRSEALTHLRQAVVEQAKTHVERAKFKKPELESNLQVVISRRP